jgi:hypothetical protein
VYDNRQIPELIIVDVSNELLNFFQISNDMQGFELTVEDLLRYIPVYIEDKQLLEVGLQAFHDDMLLYQPVEAGFENTRQMADYAKHLAIEIYKLFDSLGLYTNQGVLPYEIESFINNYTPILQIKQY